MALNIDQILAVEDLPLKEVKVPQWGGSVFVRAMNGAERDTYEAKLIDVQKLTTIEEKLAAVRGRLVFLCTVDENGERLFTTEEHYKKLMRKNWRALDLIADEAQKVNALSDDEVEEIAKNSNPNGDAGSTSA